MRCPCALAFVGAMVLSASGSSTPARLGPPASPLRVAPTETGDRPSPPLLPASILGDSARPVSVDFVELQDDRPYGEQTPSHVWLVRYEGVFGTGETTGGALSLALDERSNLICAYTDPRPQWDRSGEETGNIAVQHGWTFSPAHHESPLRSSVLDVLAVAWGPTPPGQLILRPRFNNNELGVMRSNEPPGNVWIVEALGRFCGSQDEHIATTRVVVYADGSLKQLFGCFAP